MYTILSLQTDSLGQEKHEYCNIPFYLRDKNGCCSIYVPNDKTFDSRKIQKFTGYNRKNGIEKSQPVPGTFEY